MTSNWICLKLLGDKNMEAGVFGSEEHGNKNRIFNVLWPQRIMIVYICLKDYLYLSSEL